MATAVYRVIVGGALSRPPRLDEYRLLLVAADNGLEAELVAAQIAACTCVMPVSTQLCRTTTEIDDEDRDQDRR